MVRGDPFGEIIPATPIPDETDEVDLRAVELGETEYGDTWTEPLVGQSWLTSGATGSGKNSLVWNPLRAIGPLIRDGLVRVWMVDPKGGMETLRARDLFHRWADHVEDTDEDDEDKGLAYRGEAAMEVVEVFRDEMKTTQLAVRPDRAHRRSGPRHRRLLPRHRRTPAHATPG